MRIGSIVTVLLASSVFAQPTVQIVAGHKLPNNVPATSAYMGGYTLLAADGAGNLYAAPYSKYVVYKITPAGQLSILAGNGRQGFGTGDGGPATSATLDFVEGLAADQGGNVYISGGAVVRRVAPNGTISRFAGGGSSTQDRQPATQVSLSAPTTLAAAGSTLYILSRQGTRIDAVDLTTNNIIHVAGATSNGGNTGDGGPPKSAEIKAWDMTADAQGNIYILQQDSLGLAKTVRRIQFGVTIERYLGGGASKADGTPRLSADVTPAMIKLGPSGLLYFADGNLLRMVNAAGQVVTVSTPGVPFASDIAFDPSGNLFVYTNQYADSRIRRITPQGAVSVFAGGGSIGDGGPALQAELGRPRGVAVRGNELFFAEYAHLRVRKVDLSTGVISTYAGNGLDADTGAGGPATQASFGSAYDLAVHPINGDLYIATDRGIKRVSRTTGVLKNVTGASGSIVDGVATTGWPTYFPEYIAFGPEGDLYASAGNRVYVISGSTGAVTVYAGNGNYGYTGDGGLATSASFSIPTSLATDSAGNLFIVDVMNNVVRRVDKATKRISTFAGNGDLFSSGDGGPATSAGIGMPGAIGVDAQGNVYLLGYLAVRKIDTRGIINVYAGSGSHLFTHGLAIDAAGKLYTASESSNLVFGISPAAVACTFTIPTAALQAPAAGGQFSLQLAASGATCQWQNPLASAAWIYDIAPTSGTGSATINFKVQANSGAARTGAIVVQGQTYSITQAAGTAACVYSLLPPVSQYDHRGGKSSFQIVAAGAGCTRWTASSDSPWAQVGPPLEGTGAASIPYRVFPHFGTAPRTARFTVGGQTFTITQAGNSEPLMNRIVRLMYFSFLGRLPTADELAFQVGSGVTREALAEAFFNAPEFKATGRFAASLYIALLQRTAEYGGWQFQRLILAEQPGVQSEMAHNFLVIPNGEFESKYGRLDTAGMIRRLYLNTVGREPSAADIAFQTPNVEKPFGAGALATALVQVPEFDNANNAKLQSFLLYATLLMRESTEAERRLIEYDLALPGGLRTLIARFVNSAEFNAILQ